MKEKFKDDNQMDPRASAFATQSKEKFARCRKCSVDEDGLWGTPLARRDVHAVLPDNRRIVVARVDQCMRCGQVYAVKMFNAAGEHEIYAGTLEACVKETWGTMYTLEELRTGRVDLRNVPPFPSHKSDTHIKSEDHADVSGGTYQPAPVELF